MGLSTALTIKELHPKASVVVFEQGILPKGASTKNAGFACFGSLSELLNDINTIGEHATKQLVRDRWLGLQMLRKRIGDRGLGYESNGGYELLMESDLKYLDHMDRVNQLLIPIFKQPVFSENKQLVERFSFNPNRAATIISNPFEGQLHTGTMMRSLITLAARKGINLVTGAKVESFEQSTKDIHLKVSSASSEPLVFRVKKLAVCTNAFARQLLPSLEINPGRGLVLVTRPIKHLKIKGTFHYDQGYYYFRNVASRVLFGGGRNLDIQGETTDAFGINQRIMDHLIAELSEMIIPDQPFEVDHQWSGIMAFGQDKRPLVNLHSPGIGYAVRLGGMGVALGSLVGDRLARILCLPENA